MSDDEGIVYVVDDDPSIRRALHGLLNSAGWAAETFPDAPAFLAAKRPDRPGCLVLDVQLPGLTGLDLQTRLASVNEALPIIFLTGRGDIPISVRAMKAGATDFLTKPFSEPELIAAIRRAIELDRTRRAERKELDELRRRYDSLTPRERAVMAGIVSGRLNKQIAAEFGTTEVTVKEQRARVMLKMKAKSVATLVRIAERLRV